MAMATVAGVSDQKELRSALHVRHIIMLAVGGTIASGFMLASGGAIALAGPAVIIVYLLAGLVCVGVMTCLAELSLQKFTAGAFAVYAQETMGYLMGFLTGWNYWLAWAAGTSGEAVAIGTYVTSLSTFHGLPVWLVALVILVLDVAVNLIGVLMMGNYEFTLSTFKLIGLAVLIIVAVGAALGIGSSGIGATNLTNHGGFLPTGVSGILQSFLLVFFAYTGVEMVSVTAEESVDPARDVPRALIGTAALVSVTFILAALALVLIVPWQKAGTLSSPLVNVMDTLHHPALSVFMTIVVIAGSVSALDCGVYGASRMLFALAREGYFPKRVATIHATRKVPTLAILVSGALMFLGVLLDVLSPNYAYVFLGSLATLGFLWAWAIIPVSLILYRVKLGAERVAALPWRIPFYPVLPVACIVAVAVAIIGPIFQNTPGLFGINGGALPVVAGAIWMAVWALYYLAVGRNFKHGHEYRAQTAPDSTLPTIGTK